MKYTLEKNNQKHHPWLQDNKIYKSAFFPQHVTFSGFEAI